MSNPKFADDDVEIKPESMKSGKVKWIALIGMLAVVTYVVFEVAVGKQDSKKQTAEVQTTVTAEAGAQTEKANDQAVRSMVANDGGINSVGKDKEREMQRRLEADARAAKEEAENKRTATAKAERRNGYPRSIDPATGLPRDDADPNNPQGPKVAPLPGKAEGWDPEGEVFVGGGQAGVPAYRMVPAYLRGSDVPYDAATMAAWDQAWIAAGQKPSFGKHAAVAANYSKIAGELEIKRRGGGASAAIRVNRPGEEDPRIQQPGQPTPVQRQRVHPVRVQVYPGGAR